VARGQRDGSIYRNAVFFLVIRKFKLRGLSRERTIPTERHPLVGEVSASFRGWSVSPGQRDGSNFRDAVFFYLFGKLKLRGLSPRADSTDRATAACRRS
jgi:hypothetical protein